MEPFDWAKFLSDLAAKHGSSEKGVLLEGAFKSREYNFNIAMGSYEGVLQAARTGGAKVSGIPTFLYSHLQLLAATLCVQDTFVWQFKGSSRIWSGSDDSSGTTLQEGDIELVQNPSQIGVSMKDNEGCLVAITNIAFD